MSKIVDQFFSFVEKSPTAFHAVKQITDELAQKGFLELNEKDSWTIEAGGKYYVTRNQSAVLAFRIPEKTYRGFSITASHSDSPMLKIKENAVIAVSGSYAKLNIEVYGGMLMNPWFDRPLSVAGRLLVREGASIRPVLVNIDRDLLIIPSLAIHMDRKANSEKTVNPQNEMLPLFSSDVDEKRFMTYVAQAAAVDVKDILACDLYVYNRDKGTYLGPDQEFIGCPRIDDLQCAYGTFEGFLTADAPQDKISVYALFDNEEVGSESRQAAGSTLLFDSLTRINSALGKSDEDYHRAIANSFLISADNGHALHPAYTDKADPTNRPVLNGGIVLKYAGNQKYTTDGVSAAILKTLCQKAEVPVQTFQNRADIPGGSTLGIISQGSVPILSVDIGLPQLAMHSCFETAGAGDLESLVALIRTFYEAKLEMEQDSLYRLS